MAFTLDDIKREAFSRAGESPSAPSSTEDLDVTKLAERLRDSGHVSPGQDDGLLHEYHQMLKTAQKKAAEKLGLVNGHLSLRS